MRVGPLSCRVSRRSRGAALVVTVAGLPRSRINAASGRGVGRVERREHRTRVGRRSTRRSIRGGCSRPCHAIAATHANVRRARKRMCGGARHLNVLRSATSTTAVRLGRRSAAAVIRSNSRFVGVAPSGVAARLSSGYSPARVCHPPRIGMTSPPYVSLPSTLAELSRAFWASAE
jgi:hypothetical protein